MKSLRFLMIAMMAVSLFFTSCGLLKKTPKKTQPQTTAVDSLEEKDFLNLVYTTHTQKTHFVSSKVKFTVEYGP